jgi:2-polyprenyl-3-methyl-5-hydroxy-6-metoxy-1,4-benzoquinol methylase
VLSLIKRSIMARSRSSKTAHFFSICPTGSKVLDVGVSGKHIPEQPLNHLLEHYIRDPSSYTALGLDDMSALQAAHPRMTFVQYDGITMPFADHEFDWIYCNAVIEHVGSESDQLRFLSEMLRVSKHVFFTTPNRYFPIEVHSTTAFLHWNRRAFDRWARAYKPWLSNERLRLLSRDDLVSLLKRTPVRNYTIYSNRLLGLTMTFSVVADS